MIILHGSVRQGRFYVWGERPRPADATEPVREPSLDESAEESAVEAPESSPAEERRAPKRGRRFRRRGGPSNSPYDPGLTDLEAVIGVPVDRAETAGENRSAVAWLPSAKGEPIPSSRLIGPLPDDDDKVTLAPWKLAVVSLDTPKTVEFLCSCLDRQTLGPGIIIGPDLAYCATALRFAGMLVAKEQFLPGIRLVRGRYQACWDPIFLADDAKRLAQLARAMPASVRALPEERGTPPGADPADVLRGFLGECIDHLVRSRAGGRADAPHRGEAAAPERGGKRRGKRNKPHREQRGEERPVQGGNRHERWSRALRSPNRDLGPAEKEWEQLADQVRTWRRPMTVAAESPFRLCFRLEEPPPPMVPVEDEPPVETVADKRGDKAAEKAAAKSSAKSVRVESDDWKVQYLLQATDDPSLIIPAADAWRGTSDVAAVLQARNFRVHEYLLATLGQACSLCPRIEGSLKGAVPGGYELNAAGAHEFLTEKAILLRQAGFGVMLPAWWAGKGTKVKLAVRASVQSSDLRSGGGLSLDEIIQFKYEVALGDQRVSLAELKQLAKLKAPLINVRGQWIEVGPEELKAALTLLENKTRSSASLREVVQMALGAGELADGIPISGVDATGWVGELLDRLSGRAEYTEKPPPGDFHGTLRPYQVRGYSWLDFHREWGLGACLADDMGLGKTIQALALIRSHWNKKKPRPTLLICPMSVVGNWQKEAERFTPDLPVMVHHGTTRVKGAEFKKAAAKQGIVISSYGLLHRDQELLESVEWETVILDEAQNIKNPSTRQAQAARSLTSRTRIALTGTPVENSVGDLWSIMDFLNPGFLGRQAEFKRQFFVPIQTQRDPDAAERLKRLTGPFVLRRLKTDKSIIADLPDKLEMKVFCTLTKEQASLYEAVVRETEEALKDSEGIQRKGIVLATLVKLKQVCNHPAQFLGDMSSIVGRSGKLARLTEMLEEILTVGERTLVFSQFAEMGGILQRHLQETFNQEVPFLHGGVPKKQRDRMVERFQAEGGPGIFILSLKAGGTGLNLTHANHVFHFDRWWNPAVENQATDRAFRIGQTRNVQVHKFLCVGTLEEKIDEMIERKRNVAEQVVGTGEGWLTELSNEQLRDLFTLRESALGE